MTLTIVGFNGGGQVRVGIDAPKSVHILREELMQGPMENLTSQNITDASSAPLDDVDSPSG